ncbi:MAG: hypothetical protein ACJ72N_07275 [Labedaea sp.]|jgi:hypothetical protein
MIETYAKGITRIAVKLAWSWWREDVGELVAFGRDGKEVARLAARPEWRGNRMALVVTMCPTKAIECWRLEMQDRRGEPFAARTFDPPQYHAPGGEFVCYVGDWEFAE